MMTDAELRDAFITSVMEDNIGLYEAYWEVPDGEIYDTQLGYSKERNWEDVASIIYSLIEDEFASLLFGCHRISEDVSSKAKEIIFLKNNWEPFDIIEGPGYLLGMGRELEARLAAGLPIRQRPPD